MNIASLRLCLCLFLIATPLTWSQSKVDELTANYIKSAAFVKDNQSVVPFFKLGERIQFEFDDLLAGESNYYYNITQYNYNWSPSTLSKMEYIDGMDRQRIASYENSFNTLQLYAHYRLSLPQANYKILKSGNYTLEIYNSQDEVIIRRKFVLYEDRVAVAAQIKRTRDLEFFDQKHNVEFTVRLGEQEYQNPVQNVKVALFQNGKWSNYLSNLKPQYTLGNDLIYKYNKETQFWAGNEYLNFDNNDIRGTNNHILRVESNEIYSSYLYTDLARAGKPYTYFPDINGAFFPRIINREKASIEADYAWVYFTLATNQSPDRTAYYVTGMFNNYELTPDNLMVYNPERQAYEKALLIKQGFTNYQYTAVKNNRIDPEQDPDGNFAETENQYQILVYYRGNTDQYDRVIGMGQANSQQITY